MGRTGFQLVEADARRRMPGKGGLIVVVSIALITCLLLTACGRPKLESTDRTTPQAMAPSPPAASQASPTAGIGWPERTLPRLAAALAHDGFPGELVQQPDTPDLYGVMVPTPPLESPTPAPPPRAGRLERIDLASQQVTLGPDVPADARIMTIGASVYLFTPQGMTAQQVPIGPYSLRPIDGTSLGRPVSLPFLNAGSVDQSIVIATSNPPLPSHGLWIAQSGAYERSSLWLVDSQTGGILKRETVTGEIRSIAPDPAGQRLYLARFTQPSYEATPSATPSATPAARIWGAARTGFQAIPVGSGNFPPYFFIDELDARTGRLVASSGQEIFAAGAGLTAVNGGVWISERSGMSGDVYLLREADLARVKSPAFIPKRIGKFRGAPAEWAYLTGSILWLKSEVGLSCVRPTSGTELAELVFPNPDFQPSGQLTPIASWNHWVYALVDNGQAGSTPIVAIQPPAICGS